MGGRYETSQKDHKQILLNLIKEEAKKKKFVHRKDIQPML